MNIFLWVLQFLLATLFLWHGWLYYSPPPDVVATLNAQFSQEFSTFIGIAELLGALGLVGPSITRIWPVLTPIAAMGLTLITGSACAYHLSRGETGNAIFAFTICALAAFVAYMRWKGIPLSPRPTS